MGIKQYLIVFAHAFVLWFLCTAVMAGAMGMFEPDVALIVHAVAAPLLAGGISFAYFKRFSYTSPLETAGAFLGFVIFMDAFFISFLVLRSFDMFSSVVGTWIPFLLIYASTYIVGVKTRK